jgi:hypothetical protein
MASPNLTFFCELESQPLGELFEDPTIIASLSNMNARLSMGLVDFSPTRAEVVRKLNQADIPVTAWLLLPKQEGYWLDVRNAPQALSRYQEFREWTRENNLSWSAVGLDVEPDIRDLRAIQRDPSRLLKLFLSRSVKRTPHRIAQSAYTDLVQMIHSDGYITESYQLPIIADERLVGSKLLRRLIGIVDIPVDREVWRLYTSFLGQNGVGLLWNYAPEAQAIGLGITSEGVEGEVGNFPLLTWDELARDLRLAWYWNDDIYVFSLEGCTKRGFLPRLEDFAWDMPILFPEAAAQNIRSWRGGLQTTLWILSHLPLIFGVALSTTLAIVWVRKWLARESESID